MVGTSRSMREASATSAVLNRDVEVDAQQHAFAFDIHVVEGAEGFHLTY